MPVSTSTSEGAATSLALRLAVERSRPTPGWKMLPRTEADGHGQGRGGEIEDQGLGGDPAQTAHIAHAGGAGDQGGQYQRHDDHADEIDEQVAEGFEEGGADAHPGASVPTSMPKIMPMPICRGGPIFFGTLARNLTACCVV